jgi:hypothetical protein
MNELMYLFGSILKLIFYLLTLYRQNWYSYSKNGSKMK